jgi:hypothetical protein
MDHSEEIQGMVMFLKEELAAGRAKINSQDTINALARVRVGADGKVDPSSVDGLVRASARALLASRFQSEVEGLPLRDVQGRYFDILDRNFGKAFERMREQGATPQQVADAVASKPLAVDAFNSEVEELASGFANFWEFHGPIVEAHLNDLKSLKSVFGGDVFPSYISNVACSVGLYMDTIVLPDPLSSLLALRAAMSPKELFRLVIKHALNALGCRELVLAEVNPPIVVIASDRFGLDKGYSVAVKVAGDVDALIHAGRIFGRSFESVEELIDFVDQLGDALHVVGKMVEPTRLIFDGEWTEPLPDQLVRYAAMRTVGAEKGFGGALYRSIAGRMMMANNSLLGSSLVGGSPYIDAPASWKYLQWKYEYDAAAGLEPESTSHTLIAKALESSLLTGLPPETLIELRQKGAASELREMIGKGIREISAASNADVSGVSEAVIANIDGAFAAHSQRLRALTNSKVKFYGADVGRFVANCGFGLASLATGSRVLGALAFISQMTGSPMPDDLWKRYKELREQSTDLRRSPVGAMFHHLGEKFGFPKD